MRRSTASEPDCSGRCAWRARRVPPNSAISPISSASQSMGSIELSRRRGSAVSSKICRTSPASEGAGRAFTIAGKSRPQRPRLIPESTSSLPPAATNPSTCLSTLRGADFWMSLASEGSRKMCSGSRTLPESSGWAGSAFRASCASSRNECAKRSSAQMGTPPEQQRLHAHQLRRRGTVQRQSDHEPGPK